MTQWNSTRGRAFGSRPAIRGPQPLLAVFVLATVAGLAVLVWIAPATSLLPLTSLSAIAGAAVVALGAWWSGAERSADKVDGWDLAGALAFIGIAAGMLTEPDQILQFFGHGTMTR